ncbi:AraC family transcriptional regulator [Roseateles sp.]|uniref:AraC family transcriptional regulator n=1 Tax=Roseateles sp. TaxID=1971397 RepID=UPI0039EC733E
MAGVAAMASFAREHQISVDRMLAGTGLQPSDLDRPGATLSADGELRAIQNLIALAGHRPALGIDVGGRYRFTSVGELGFAMVSSHTLLDATTLLHRYSSLFDRLVQIELRAESGFLSLQFKPSPVDGLEVRRFLVDRAMGAVLAVLRDIAGQDLHAHNLALAYSRPADLLPYASLTSTGLRFDADASAFHLACTDSPLPRSNALAAMLAEAQCRQASEAVSRRGGVSARVVAVLQLSDMRDMSAVAAKLCMSERTLRRNLQREHTTFQALCDEIRERKAEQLLTDSRLPIEHIAEKLGYAESASFIHAFKRWKGSTPQAFRRDICAAT